MGPELLRINPGGRDLRYRDPNGASRLRTVTRLADATAPFRILSV